MPLNMHPVQWLHNQCISVVLCSAYKSVCGGTYVHDLLMLCYSQWCFFLLIVYALVSHTVVQCIHTYVSDCAVCMSSYILGCIYFSTVQYMYVYVCICILQ